MSIPDTHTSTGSIVWFTGLSGAGKSTLANAVGKRIAAVGPVEILDGDEIRAHLSKGLGFSKEDRDTNVQRIGFVARLLARHGVIVLTAAISPYADARASVRRLAQAKRIPFVEVFLNPRLESLIARDVKGLYKRALAGEIQHFTGISDPYEPPTNPEITIVSDAESVELSTARILTFLIQRGLLAMAVRTNSDSV